MTNNKYKDIKRAQMESTHKMKANTKRIAICVLCLFPIFVVVSFLLNELNIALWLIMTINIVLGGGFSFLVYVLGEKNYEKQKAKQLLDTDKDPFKD